MDRLVRSVRRARVVALACIALGLALGSGTRALSAETTIATQQHSFRIVTLARGLEHPWGLAFLPDGRLLVTERPGRLRIIGANGTLEPQPVSGLPKISEYGQGGLLDVSLHPRYAENQLVYLSYAGRNRGLTLIDAIKSRF